jgi:hypothetical protein
MYYIRVSDIIHLIYKYKIQINLKKQLKYKKSIIQKAVRLQKFYVYFLYTFHPKCKQKSSRTEMKTKTTVEYEQRSEDITTISQLEVEDVKIVMKRIYDCSRLILVFVSTGLTSYIT